MRKEINADTALKNVLGLMKAAGFPVTEDVKVVVDEKLSFMGYTSQTMGTHTVVVSGFAVKSDMFEGLLMHEVSHVYRTVTKHPSHNYELIAEAVNLTANKHKLHEDYQQDILHQIVNSIQDLYADDILTKVLNKQKSQLFPPETLSEFFLGWVSEKPITDKDKIKSKWINASLMLKNSFAISNMQRHEMKDIGGKAGKRNEEFLLRLPAAASKEFNYFNRFMAGLKEDITNDQFSKQLKEYIERFLVVVKRI